MDACDARWVACLIDTEGTITINRSRRADCSTRYMAQMSCGMTSEAMLLELVRIVGVGSVLPRKNAGRFRQMYCWQIASKKCVPLLIAIRPWLIIKREQADLALLLEARKRPQKRMGTLTLDEVELREGYKLRMTALNA